MKSDIQSNGQQTEVSKIEQINFFEAFKFWLKLGFISFGRPAGQISIMHEELVVRRRWISDKRFLHALNYTMLLPGPEAQQLATYIGWLMHGIRGGIVAGMLFVLPSFFIMSILAWLYLVYGELAAVKGVLYGVKPAVVAIVFFAAYRIGKNVLKHTFLWLLAVLAFIAIAVFHIAFPYIVIVAAMLGWLVGRMSPQWFREQDHDVTSSDQSLLPAIINDDSAPPVHAQFSWVQFMTHAIVGVCLIIGLLLALIMTYGWDSVFTQIGWFFTKAALVTFGGAYAVLPYVHQGGVEVYEWLTSTQMIDGLALGETTPGPLIMIVAFVGFVGGWTAQIGGSESMVMTAWFGAVIAMMFTFLPSFIFILVGGPLVEMTRDNLSFTAPLTAVTAAVVGVILNLAVFFAIHTFWPNEFGVEVEWLSVFLSIVVFVLLLKYKIGVISIIFACAILGLIYKVVI